MTGEDQSRAPGMRTAYAFRMDGIDWAAQTMANARDRLDLTTKDLANATSDGYHGHAARTRLDDGGLHLLTTERAGQGPLRATGRPFDLAITGAGRFLVAGGEPGHLRAARATREGAFTRDASGYLRNDRGEYLLGERGALRVPPNAQIGADGVVRAGGRVVDRILAGSRATIRTGSLESSNVDSVAMMVAIIDAQRSFETGAKALSAIDQTRQKAANDVGTIKA